MMTGDGAGGGEWCPGWGAVQDLMRHDDQKPKRRPLKKKNTQQPVLVPIFKNYFLFLKTKNLFGKKMYFAS